MLIYYQILKMNLLMILPIDISNITIGGVSGTAGQILKINAGATALEYTTVLSNITEGENIDIAGNTLSVVNPLQYDDLSGNPIDSNGKIEKFVCCKTFNDGTVKNTYSNDLYELGTQYNPMYVKIVD